jgi:prepilin-type N-terminal cleavage/methylation domain-containing protein
VRRGFTLLEVLICIALVSLLGSMLLLVVVRLARMTRETTQAAMRRRHWIEAAENIRWQLRNLHVPSTKNAPESVTRAGLVGTHETSLWGEPGNQEGTDAIYFLTTRPKRQQGVCEVGFRLRARPGGNYDLIAREFPLRERGGVHSNADFSEAPWKVALDDVTHLSFDYSEDGWKWRRDWTETAVPRRIRVHLEAPRLPVLDFQVTPGVGGGRW